jgi:UDP-N-acetylglucosamine--N-acetylmuramyl-(pentapeptide) pyrophosphoryl-undecaprenol N-acetylglucosamine transferase
VPYPFAAGDHQAKNARRIAEAGAALVIANAELDARKVTAAVSELLRLDVNKRMREAALALAVPDAADRIADVVVELLTRHAG